MADYIILRNRDIDNLADLKTYRDNGGYEGLKKTLGMEPAAVIQAVKDSGLRGRGGAGFPTGAKWSFVPTAPGVKYVAVNADESEPGTFKDREILESNPHQMIEGALIAAYAIGANAIYIYCRGEFWDLTHDLDKHLEAARKAGLIGRNILKSGWDCEVYTHLGAGAYICGEETALLESLEGKRGYPRIRPPFPAVVGLYGQPTVINNVETLANVPFIMDQGVEEYRKIGTQSSTGTKIFCMSGDVERPGNYEAPFGVTFAELLDMAGGVPGGRAVKAILPAGASAAILPGTEEVLNTPIEYGSLKPWNTDIGSASVIVLDETHDMVWAARKMIRFFAHESCGQCTPCREGTYWLKRLYDRAAEGQLDMGDVERMNSVASQMKGKCICALGEFAVNPVVATIRHFPEDYEAAAAAADLPDPGVTYIPVGQVEDLKAHLTIRRDQVGH